MKRICFVVILAIIIYSGYAMPSTRLLYLHFDDATYIDALGGDTGADGASRAFNSPYIPDYNPDPIRTDLPSPQGGQNVRARISTYSDPDHTQPLVWVNNNWNLSEFYIKFYMYIEPDITDDELESIKMFRVSSGDFDTEFPYTIILCGPEDRNSWVIYHTDECGTWSPPNVHPGYQQGKWVKYEFYTKYNTPGVSNGILRIWVDGKLSWDKIELNFRSDPSQDMDSFGAVYHFKTLMSPIGEIEGHVRIDGIEVWDGIPPNRDNKPPVLEPVGNKSVKEGALLTFTISATDPDEDALTYSASGLPTGATFTDRTFSWTPTYEQAGSYDVTFKVSDGKEGTDSETITITVNDVYRPPAPGKPVHVKD